MTHACRIGEDPQQFSLSPVTPSPTRCASTWININLITLDIVSNVHSAEPLASAPVHHVVAVAVACGQVNTLVAVRYFLVATLFCYRLIPRAPLAEYHRCYRRACYIIAGQIYIYIYLRELYGLYWTRTSLCPLFAYFPRAALSCRFILLEINSIPIVWYSFKNREAKRENERERATIWLYTIISTHVYFAESIVFFSRFW